MSSGYLAIRVVALMRMAIGGSEGTSVLKFLGVLASWDIQMLTLRVRSGFRKYFVCLFGLLLMAALIPIGTRVWKLLLFSHHKNIGVELIESLHVRRPREIDTQTWDSAVNATLTAYHNVFFSSDRTAISEVRAFNEDAKIRFARNVDRNSLDWTWYRLEHAGPYGQEYVGRFNHEYVAIFESIEKHAIGVEKELDNKEVGTNPAAPPKNE